MGEGAPTAEVGRGRFVVQKHAATHLHHDLRLEHGGVLMSWAVPRGPSLDPQEKRLAVKVEDHPIEYADFEGRIPDGNYGAGHVIVWDKGSYTALEDFEAGFAKGKLLFELHGYKLRGVFTLVRTKKKGVPISPEWLLIKKPDKHAAKDAAKPLPEESVLSGLTVEELATGVHRGAAIVAAADALGAKRLASPPADPPMLAETADAPFSREGWLFELKYDGFRLVADRSGPAAKLRYRSGLDATGMYPEIAKALSAWPFHVVLDGEVVVLDDQGHPTFNRLQQRANLTRRDDLARTAVLHPATYFVFDLPWLEGRDLRSLPLAARKDLLARLLPKIGPVRFADHVETLGSELFAEVQRRGLEGIMAKKADSPYVARRSPHWLKMKAERTGEFVIVGMTPPKGSRSGFGALELAVWDPDAKQLVYCGRAGSGFSQDELAEIPKRLTPVDAAPCVGDIPKERGRVWVAPDHVAEVRYQEWIHDVLRFPVWIRFRDDKAPVDCVRDETRHVRAPPGPAPAEPPVVKLTNPQKVFWPAGEGDLRKADLFGYYRAISRWMLPYLRERPLVLTRFPDGIHGKSFYQHDAPVFVPDWVHTERLFSEHAEREVDYFVCDDEETLAYVANLGTIPIHIWASRVSDLQRPDFSSIDLDPKSAPFEHVISIARHVRQLCEEIGLPVFVKTSGQSGLHLLVPLGRSATHEQARLLAWVIANVACAELPEIATLARIIEARGGKVYLDTLQNGHGRTLVAPFSVRPVPMAPVSMPLRWDEVKEGLTPRTFTLRDAVQRMESLGADPLLPVLTDEPDLHGALERLTARLSRR